MPKVLRGTHAEDVGGIIVEPGDKVPTGADDEVVARLEAEGVFDDPTTEPEQQPTQQRSARKAGD